MESNTEAEQSLHVVTIHTVIQAAGNFRRSLVQSIAQRRVSSKIRPGCLGLYLAGCLLLTSLCNLFHYLTGSISPHIQSEPALFDLCPLPPVLPPYTDMKALFSQLPTWRATVMSLQSLLLSKLNQPQSLSFSSQVRCSNLMTGDW